MKRQLISTEVWVFVTVLILGIIIVSIYMCFKVERPTDLQQFNQLNPFPTIKMKNIPPPKFLSQNENISDCLHQILPCENSEDCQKSCGADYTCTPVDESENLVVNGIKVGTGNWCLPKNKLSGCGKFTGQVVWSGDLQGEGWQCVCKYPSLFGGTYCLENRACKDKSIEGGGYNQINNKLVNDRGEVYDPNLTDFYPPNSEANPYALDKDGNPIYTCRCGVGTGNVRFVSLPNDPQGCNLDPCTPSHTSPLWSEQSQTCICGLDGVIKQDGTCEKAQCTYGSFNPVTQNCDCIGRMSRVRCNPRNKIWDDNVPLCTDPENKLGWECIDRCIYNYCEDDNYNNKKCGGKNGYRPEFFEKSAVVCRAGTCKFDENDNVCCACPNEHYYSTDPKTFGVCKQNAIPAGHGCYHELNGVRGFWGWTTDGRNGTENSKIRFENIDYQTSGAIGVDDLNQTLAERADAKCKTRCLSDEGAAVQAETATELLNKLAGVSKDDANTFLSHYCTNVMDNLERMKFMDITYADPEKRAGDKEIKYVCGFMCDGDKVTQPSNPEQQCRN